MLSRRRTIERSVDYLDSHQLDLHQLPVSKWPYRYGNTGCRRNGTPSVSRPSSNVSGPVARQAAATVSWWRNRQCYLPQTADGNTLSSLFICLFVRSFVCTCTTQVADGFWSKFQRRQSSVRRRNFLIFRSEKGPSGGKIFNLLPTVVPREIEWPIHLGEVFFWLPTTSSDIRKRDHRGEHFGGRPNCVRSNRFTISDMVTWEILGVEHVPQDEANTRTFKKHWKYFFSCWHFDFCCC